MGYLSFFKAGDKMLTSVLTQLMGSIWVVKEISENWCESMIVSIYNKGGRSSQGNHSESSLASVASKLLKLTNSCRISSNREKRTQKIAKYIRTFLKPWSLSLIKSAFDSVDHAVLCRYLTLHGMPEKFI